MAYNYTRLTAAEARRTWYIMFYALLASLGVHIVLVQFLLHSGTRLQETAILHTLRPICYFGALACVIGSILWADQRIRRRMSQHRWGSGEPATGLSPQEFIASTIVGLAIAETCTILGLLLFVLGAPFAEFIWFAVATGAVFFSFYLPLGNQYWDRNS